MVSGHGGKHTPKGPRETHHGILPPPRDSAQSRTRDPRAPLPRSTGAPSQRATPVMDRCAPLPRPFLSWARSGAMIVRRGANHSPGARGIPSRDSTPAPRPQAGPIIGRPARSRHAEPVCNRRHPHGGTARHHATRARHGLPPHEGPSWPPQARGETYAQRAPGIPPWDSTGTPRQRAIPFMDRCAPLPHPPAVDDGRQAGPDLRPSRPILQPPAVDSPPAGRRPFAERSHSAETHPRRSGPSRPKRREPHHGARPAPEATHPVPSSCGTSRVAADKRQAAGAPCTERPGALVGGTRVSLAQSATSGCSNPNGALIPQPGFLLSPPCLSTSAPSVGSSLLSTPWPSCT